MAAMRCTDLIIRHDSARPIQSVPWYFYSHSHTNRTLSGAIWGSVSSWWTNWHAAVVSDQSIYLLDNHTTSWTTIYNLTCFCVMLLPDCCPDLSPGWPGAEVQGCDGLQCWELRHCLCSHGGKQVNCCVQLTPFQPRHLHSHLPVVTLIPLLTEALMCVMCLLFTRWFKLKPPLLLLPLWACPPMMWTGY